MHRVKKPLFILNSLDDPFYGPHVVPIDHSYEHVLIGTTKRGGHCSYLTGTWIPRECWWGLPAFEYIDFFNKKCKQDSLAEEQQRRLKQSPKKSAFSS